MGRYIITIIILIQGIADDAQTGFEIPVGKKKIEIGFQSIFNLIVLPVQVNGTELNMILDTGASKSIIFNFSGIDSLTVTKGDILKIGGYGTVDYFEAYYSQDNIMNINGYVNPKANLFIASKTELNLEPTLGIPVHGLIGADFFANHYVGVDYLKNIITIYDRSSFSRSRLRRWSKIPLSFIGSKPYITTSLKNGQSTKRAKLLLDSGSGDTLWLYDPPDDFEKSKISFGDFLGLGLNGEVYGKRSKVDNLLLSKYKLPNITIAYPSKNSSTVPDYPTSFLRGSIGAGVLCRFNLIFDYQEKSIYLKSNKTLKEGFYYNMAGIDLIAGKFELFTQIINYENYEYQRDKVKNSRERLSTSKKLYKYLKAPKIEVASIKEGSPADLAGVKVGDEIIAINRLRKGEMTLHDAASIFYRNPYSRVRLKVKRQGKMLKMEFKLLPLI